jgi:hypothetical protein
MLCYSCESQKENSECQINPNQTTTMMCESKQQICYSKKTTNADGKLSKFTKTFSYLINFLLNKSRKTSTIQSWLHDASDIDRQSYSTITMSIKQSRRKDYMREILPSGSVQQRGYKVNFFRNLK